MAIYMRGEQTYFEFAYTWDDQFLTVTPWTYRIICKWAWSNNASWGLWQWDISFPTATTLAIMVGWKWSRTDNWTTYGFGWSTTYGWRWGWWLSWVFTWNWAITDNDSSRVLVIWWWAWGWLTWGWAWGWENWQNWNWWAYWRAWGWATQTAKWSWNSAWWQFQGWWWTWTYWFWWWGWWYWWWWSWGDGSVDDDAQAGGWSGYVISSASNRILTQWWGSAAWEDWFISIEFLWLSPSSWWGSTSGAAIQ